MALSEETSIENLMIQGFGEGVDFDSFKISDLV